MDSNGDLDLDSLLRELVRQKGSDLHLKVGRPPLFRIAGDLYAQPLREVTEEDMERFRRQVLRHPELERRFETRFASDQTYKVDGLGRFRTNLFRYRGTVGVVFRNLSSIPTIESLGLPPVLHQFCLREQGLVLVTGPAGQGKSTTLAAMIHQINMTRKCHIVTLEDPIEFLHEDNMAEITQREIGIDTPTFADGLRDVLRQDPDVILLGEMRDTETISTAITAAETGHLVFATLHTRNAPATISRIVDTFPPSQQEQVRLQLSDALVGVICQRLVPLKSGKGRTAALEIMFNQGAIPTLISRNELKEIKEVIEKSVTYYRMQSMNQSLAALIVNGMVTQAEANKVSERPKELELILNNLGYVGREKEK